jgi:hypothetical protein
MIRFKVQEMHFLNDLYNHYSAIDYISDKDSTWFDFSKTIRNNILVEMNINALTDVYDLNTSMFKEVIGSLNWKKFAERIKTQLKENQNLTQNQRNSMEINIIISLIKSNTFDEAKSLLEKIMKKPQFQSAECQAIFRGLKVFFLIREKKNEEALALIPAADAAESDIFSVLMRAQLYLDTKRQKECVLELIKFIQKNEIA